MRIKHCLKDEIVKTGWGMNPGRLLKSYKVVDSLRQIGEAGEDTLMGKAMRKHCYLPKPRGDRRQ